MLKNNRWLKLLFSLCLSLFLAVGLFFSGYKKGLLRRLKTSVVRLDCQTDADCVLVIDRADCCSCPTPVNKDELSRHPTWEIYPRPTGLMRDQREREECKGIFCELCPSWEKAVCESGICKGKSSLGVTPPPSNKVFCQDPRPELCTLECLAQPPYLCGSDGKSYCSACQACSHKEVEWYVIQDKLCEEE